MGEEPVYSPTLNGYFVERTAKEAERAEKEAALARIACLEAQLAKGAKATKK